MVESTTIKRINKWFSSALIIIFIMNKKGGKWGPTTIEVWDIWRSTRVFYLLFSTTKQNLSSIKLTIQYSGIVQIIELSKSQGRVRIRTHIASILNSNKKLYFLVIFPLNRYISLIKFLNRYAPFICYWMSSYIIIS